MAADRGLSARAAGRQLRYDGHHVSCCSRARGALLRSDRARGPRRERRRALARTLARPRTSGDGGRAGRGPDRSHRRLVRAGPRAHRRRRLLRAGAGVERQAARAARVSARALRARDRTRRDGSTVPRRAPGNGAWLLGADLARKAGTMHGSRARHMVVLAEQRAQRGRRRRFRRELEHGVRRGRASRALGAPRTARVLERRLLRVADRLARAHAVRRGDRGARRAGGPDDAAAHQATRAAHRRRRRSVERGDPASRSGSDARVVAARDGHPRGDACAARLGRRDGAHVLRPRADRGDAADAAAGSAAAPASA